MRMNIHYSLQIQQTADAILAQDFARLLQRHGAPAGILSAGYGTTETGTLVTGSRDFLAYDPEQPVGLGRPRLGVSMRIVGDDGEILPVGEVGELEVRCPEKLFSRYWDPNCPADEGSTADGWWR